MKRKEIILKSHLPVMEFIGPALMRIYQLMDSYTEFRKATLPNELASATNETYGFRIYRLPFAAVASEALKGIVKNDTKKDENRQLMKYQNIREEELKNKVAQDYFWIYDCSKIIGNVDFCVCMHQSQKELFEQESLLWAEAKKGSSDIYKSVVQLILTIGKARTFDKFLPPAILGAFDGEKIAFIPDNDVHEVFYINDFNWNVTPSLSKQPLKTTKMCCKS
jgi:hypothetical protein